MVEVVSPTVRTAQRRVVRTVSTSGVLGGDGLGIWREANCGDGRASAAEVAKDLALLNVPHQVVAAYRPPLAIRAGRVRRGEEIRILAENLGRLVQWMPSLQRQIHEVRAEVGGFSFVYLEPRPEGCANMRLALACDWPSWTDNQASAMGLMCGRCRYDLRLQQDDRRPYNIPLPTQPRIRRLLCGRCCNDGQDEQKRLAGLAEQRPMTVLQRSLA